MKYTITIASLIATAGFANATVLFTSDFDGNDSSTSYTKDASGSATAAVTWTKDAAITTISGLTAVTSGGGAGAGFVNQSATYSDGNNIKVNYNLSKGGTEGFSLTFTLAGDWTLDKINVLAGHTNDSAASNQAYTSDLTIALSGGTLGSTLTQTTTEDHNTGAAYHSVDFSPAATTLGAGTYTLQVSMDNLVSGGAYAMFDGVTLEATAVPEPSSTALLGLGGLALILRRRK